MRYLQHREYMACLIMGDTGLCHRLRRKTSDDALARAEEVVEVVPRGELTLKASPIRCRYSTLPARKRKLASRRRFLPRALANILSKCLAACCAAEYDLRPAGALSVRRGLTVYEKETE